MSDTWTKYCEKLEELRRLQDEARKRRKVGSAGIEIIDKTHSVGAGVPDSVEGAAGTVVDEGDSNG